MPQGKTFHYAKGAPQAIADLVQARCRPRAASITDTVSELAGKGYRALGVASSRTTAQTWTLLGHPVADRPAARPTPRRPSTRHGQAGLAVKMVTGDDVAIGIEIAKQLGMGDHHPGRERRLQAKDIDPDHVPPAIADAIEKADGFGRVFPQHKYEIVKSLAGSAAIWSR